MDIVTKEDSMLKTVATKLLVMAYDEQGSSSGWPVILLHGFPYDIHAYDDVAASLGLKGARVTTPYLRLRSHTVSLVGYRPVRPTSRDGNGLAGFARRIEY
jgi:pimeloyl-ACP methyl ester carboxylesterase